ncbi:MAG: GWxTD domain-containing protein [Microscillaceae bacterium]|nr:GWxTD domain-containing protein [Microscillaceae bacterium]MDW8459915.1 GWxTD domain-containing protein [Cytophagales bacterium]
MFSLLLLFLSACNRDGYPTSVPQTQNSESSTKTLVDNRKMSCQYVSLSLKDSLRIMFRLHVPRLEKSENLQDFINSFKVMYGILPDYNSQHFLISKQINLENAKLTKQDIYYYLTIEVPKKPDVNEVMLIEFADSQTGKRLVQDLPLIYITAKFREVYSLFDKNGQIPLFASYLTTADTVQISSWQEKESKPLWVKYYKPQFPSATTPMATTGQNILPKNIPADSIFQVQSHQKLTFRKAGLYAVANDTTVFYSLSFWVDNNRNFPKYTHPKELIEPLVYISLEEEMKKLTQTSTALQAKQELDRYWLKLMQGNIRKAKAIIKEFYTRVRLANQLFTSFKEGWKTDMGMIFIVFGMPNRITKSRDKQLWTYTQNPNFSEINFTFVQRPNQFTDAYYTLVRYPEYEQIWYPTVELWREGKLAVAYSP